MATNKAAITKFNNKIDALVNETGFNYEMELPDYEQLVGDNRLYASWYEPGTRLARVEGENAILVYEVSGGLTAVLKDKSGSSVKEFAGFIEPYTGDNISIENDKDLDALKAGKHESGYSLEIKEDNSVVAYIEDMAIEPMKFEDLSIARCILNKDLAVGLMARASEENEDLELPDTFEVDDKDRLPDKKINDALDAALEAIEGNAGFVAPETPSEPEEKASEPEKGDIPSFEEFAETEEGKAEIEAIKEEEEKVKKSSKTVKKTVKTKKTADSEALERYDLLPLDLIGEFVERFDEQGDEKTFFAAIEDFKKGKGSLLDAALMFAREHYVDAVDAVTALAIYAEEDAEKNGEDAWKGGDVKDCINTAIKGYLADSRGDAKEGFEAKALWGLVTGAWMAENA